MYGINLLTGILTNLYYHNLILDSLVIFASASHSKSWLTYLKWIVNYSKVAYFVKWQISYKLFNVSNL